MQDHGLEWVHRLASEPRRLWKRYLFGNTRFVRRGGATPAMKVLVAHNRYRSDVPSGENVVVDAEIASCSRDAGVDVVPLLADERRDLAAFAARSRERGARPGLRARAASRSSARCSSASGPTSSTCTTSTRC